MNSGENNKESFEYVSYFSDVNIKSNNEKSVTSIKTNNVPKTEVIYDEQAISKIISDTTSEAKNSLDVCADANGASVVMEVLTIKNAYITLRKNGVTIRFATEITKENVKYCRQMLEHNLVSELRHLNGIKGNFAIIDKSVYLATSKLEEAKNLTELIYSNVRGLVEQQQYFFETLWKKGIPSETRLREIEQGLVHESLEVIENKSQIKEIYLNLIEKSREEILIIFPSVNAVYRQDKLGIIELLKRKAAEGLKVKILSPTTDDIERILSLNDIIQMDDENKKEKIDKTSDKKFAPNFIKEILSQQNIQFTVVIIDKQYLLTIEVKDDTQLLFDDAIGIATYSNSKPRVLSYVSIFENFSLQAEMYEKLKINEKMQKEFINIAAHELRTPSQSILGYIQLALDDPRYKEVDKQVGYLDVVSKNANRLSRLIKNILSVTRIENKTLKIRKEYFNIEELILDMIEVQKKIKANNRNIELLFEKISNNTKEFVYYEKQNFNELIIDADKESIEQVLVNLLDNALKFAKEKILIRIREERRVNNTEVTVEVIDDGPGIDKDVFPNIFSKFITKSKSGTGLGLYISKSIIEAHDGQIWAKNNDDDGATVAFRLSHNKHKC